MDVNDTRWEQYEERFRALAAQAEHVPVAQPSLNAARYYLCLYGENGLTPDEEFNVLEQLSAHAARDLKRLEVDTSYWQDTILFVPPSSPG